MFFDIILDGVNAFCKRYTDMQPTFRKILIRMKIAVLKQRHIVSDACQKICTDHILRCVSKGHPKVSALLLSDALQNLLLLDPISLRKLTIDNGS